MLPELVIYPMSLPDHLVAAVICIVAPLLAFSSRKVAEEDIDTEPFDKIRLYHSNALLLAVFALVVITVWRIPGRSMAALGFTWPQWNTWVIVLMILVLLFYALDIFFQYGLRRWRERTFSQRKESFQFVPAGRKELLHFMLLALAAGIGEEIVFRGFLIHYLVFWTGNTIVGMVAAILFSSALFAFLHGYQGAKSMIKILILSMMFAGIFIWSRSLILVMVIHTVIDMVSGWLGVRIFQTMQNEVPSENKES